MQTSMMSSLVGALGERGEALPPNLKNAKTDETERRLRVTNPSRLATGWYCSGEVSQSGMSRTGSLIYASKSTVGFAMLEASLKMTTSRDTPMTAEMT